MTAIAVSLRVRRAAALPTSSRASRPDARRRGILLKTSLSLGALVIASARPVTAQLTAGVEGSYVGKIEWTDYVTGPAGSSKETVVAVVGSAFQSAGVQLNVKHVVTCHVVFVDVDQGQTTTKTADGPGLLEISFESAFTYQFTVACPNAMYTPPRQAEWSHATESYKQPWRPKVKNQAFPDSLTGGWSVPNPASDPANGVGGTLTLTWSLCDMNLPTCVNPQPRKSPP